MKESIEDKIIACTLAIVIVVYVLMFCSFSKIAYTTAVKLENEWGGYVYAMNMLPFDNTTNMIAIAQKSIQIPIVGFDFKDTVPIKAYLIDGSTREIVWKN